jgi:hypothetical protein
MSISTCPVASSGTVTVIVTFSPTSISVIVADTVEGHLDTVVVPVVWFAM